MPKDKQDYNNYEVWKCMKENDFLRSYLFLLSVNEGKDEKETTCYVRDIKWSKNEIILDTMLDDSANLFNTFVNAKKLNISFLTRNGYRTFTQTFNLKNLIQHHPLMITQTDAGPLVYRFYYEY